MPGFGSSDYEEFLGELMEYGWTRQEAHEQVRLAWETGQLASRSIAEAREYFESTVGYGYEQARQAFFSGTREEREGGFVSKATWATYPEHLKLRRMYARPVSTFEKDPYDHPIIPEGWVRRGQEAHAFPLKVITQASHLGLTPEGQSVMSYEPKKVEKRIQMLGAHETVRMSGLPEITAHMRAGPASIRPEQLHVMRGAYILGGDIGGPGQAWVDPSIGYATQRVFKEIKPERGPFDWVARKGAHFGAGERAQLGSGLVGFETGTWDYRVMDVAPTKAGGYRFTMERYQDPEQMRLRLKHGASKLAAVSRPLGDITTAGGAPLNLQFVGGLKDPGMGAAYEWFMAQGPAQLQKALQAVGYKGALPGSWAELGTAGVEAFHKVARQHAQTIHVPQVLTEEAMRRYEQSGALVSASPLGEGRYQATVAYQALIGDWAKQIGIDYPVKQPFLSHEEIEAMRRVQPELAQRLFESGAERRQAYVDITNAMRYSAGEKVPLPAGTISASEVPLAAMFQQALSQAQEITGMAEPTAMATRHQFMQLLQASEYGGAPMLLQAEGGQPLVLPSAQTMGRMSAGGKWEDEEATKYINRAAAALAAMAAGGGPEAAAAIEEARTEQRLMAGGKEFGRRTLGTFLPHGQARGDILRTSEALKPGETYLPGASAGEVVQPFAFPSQGTETWATGMRAVNIGAEKARELGLNTEQMYMSMEMTQAMGRDTDSDLAYWVSVGKAQQTPDGKWVMEDGTVLDEKTIKAQAQARIAEGAGENITEMAGATGKFPSMRTALQKMEAKAQPRIVSEQQVAEQISYGSGLRSRIGPYFNIFRGAGAKWSAAMEKIGRTAYGFAQRPAEQLPSMQRLLDLATASLWNKEEGKLSTGSYSRAARGGKGGPVPALGVGGVGGLQAAVTQRVLNLRGPERGGQPGRPLLTAEEFATGMMTDPSQQRTLERLYLQYQAETDPSRKPDLARRIAEATGGAAEWGLRSSIGAGFMPQAVARAVEKGAPISRLGLTEEQGQAALGIAKAQQQRILALSRRSAGATSEEFIAKAQAMVSVGGAASGLYPATGLTGVPAEQNIPADIESLWSSLTFGAAPTEQPVAQGVAAMGTVASAATPPPPPNFPGAASPAMTVATRPAGAQRARPQPAGAGGTGGVTGGPPTRGAPPTAPPPPPNFYGGPAGPAISGQAQTGGAGLDMFNIDPETGTMRVKPQYLEASPFQVEKLQAINEHLQKFGEGLQKVTDSTTDLSGAQRTALNDVRRMFYDVRRISQMGIPQGMEQQFTEALGGIAPHMGWMGGIGQRLMTDYAQKALAGAGGGMGLGGLLTAEGLTGAVGGIGKELLSGWGMMKMRRWWQMTGGQLSGWMQQAGQADIAYYGAAMGAGAPISTPGGVAGTLMHRQQLAQMNQQALGRQAAMATQVGVAPQWGAGPIGAAASIGLPAVGVGLISANLANAAGLAAAGPIGAGLGALTALGLGANYLYNAATDPTGVQVGLAGINRGGAQGWGGAGFGEFTGAIGQTAWQLLTQPREDVDAWVRQQSALGEQMMQGRTEGLTASQVATSFRLRGERMSREYDIMGGTEYAQMLSQMMRFQGGELADISDPYAVRTAGLTRALGLSPGALSQQIGAMGQAWGLRTGTEQMGALQSYMTWAPTVQSYEQRARRLEQMQPMAQWGVGWQQALAYGPETMTPSQERVFQGLMGGDRYMWTQMGIMTGNEAWQTIEPGTGLPWGTTQQWYMQDVMTQQQQSYAAQQRQFQQQALTGQYNYLLGYSPQDFGQTTFGAGALVQPSAGSMWGLQDQLRNLQTAGQAENWGYRFQQQQFGWQQWGLQQEMFGLQHEQRLEDFAAAEASLGTRAGQFSENWDLSRRMWQLRSQWTREDFDWQSEEMNRARAWTMQGREWTQEDWAASDVTRGREWGWDLEDIEEAIRFSSGRQRKQLLRQRERMTIRHGEEEERTETERERQEEIWAHEDENWDKKMQRLDTERDRFEEMNKLEDERFNLQRRHAEESMGQEAENLERRKRHYMEQYEIEVKLRDLQEEQREAADVHLQAQYENWEQVRDVQEEILTKQRDYQLEQLERQAEQLEAAEEYATTMEKLNEEYRDLTRQQQMHFAQFNLFMSNFGSWLRDNLPLLTDAINSSQGGTLPVDLSDPFAKDFQWELTK